MNSISLLKTTPARKTLVFSKVINELLFFCFTFFAVITPYDNFHIKKIALLGLLLVNIGSFFKKPQTWVVSCLFVFSFCFIPFSLIISLTSGSSLLSMLSELFNVLYFLLIVVVMDKKTNVRKYFLFSLKVLVALIVAGFALDYLKLLDIYQNPILLWFRDSGNMMLGKSQSYFSNYIFFFKTSPLIFYLLFNSIQKKSIVWSVLSFASILLTGTRANFFVAIFLLFVFLFFTSKERSFKLFLLFAVAVAILVFGERALSFVSRAFMLKESSDAVRTSDLNSILNIFVLHPQVLFFGDGIGSSFFSSGRNEYVVNIELSYWNLLRQFGVVGFSFFVGMYLIELICSFKRRDLMLGFFILSFMIISYTNPFLFGSTGALVLIVSADGNHRRSQKRLNKTIYEENGMWRRRCPNTKQRVF